MARVRRNVLNLPAGDETLVWYERAVGAMRQRPITDPRSWRFQAAIHDYKRNLDPYSITGEKLPSASVQGTFWSKCQHTSWFFLPWHRMYLHFFEQIVAAEVQSLGGPSDWSLPYWNYSADLQSRLLPEAFRSPTLPDGSTNYLHVDQRDPRSNAGQQFADDTDVDLRPALTQGSFSVGNVNFGGPATGFSHGGGRFGQLERVPHGLMHVAVGGGQTGWMSQFYTAALDPIFWLHHCNIDRLWVVWLDIDSTHHNPTSLQWLSTVPFSFYDVNQQVVTMRPMDVVDTNALGYTYDDTSDPLRAQPAVQPLEAIAPRTVPAMEETTPPEMVGATETSVKVGNTPSRIRVPTPAHATARRRLRAEEAVSQPRVFLQLENLTASGTANSYDVYVNVPEGVEPTQHRERFVGRLDLFGVAEASRISAQHSGSGLTYTFDISNIYNQLSAAEQWDPQNMDVSLVPVRPWEGATVTVGRVSLFFG